MDQIRYDPENYLVETLSNFKGIVASYRNPEGIEGSSTGVNYVQLTKMEVESFFTFLKLNSSFNHHVLTDLAGVDFLKDELRFTLIYVFESCYAVFPLKVILKTSEVAALVSIEKIFPNANWLEREAWDMFGVWFVKNKNMSRLLSDYGFIGHPLKKDFPITGFFELYFEEQSKYLEYTSVELAQGMRIINLNSNTWDA